MRKKLSKILSVSFMMIILFGALCINSFAAASATISLSSSSVMVGSTVTATIKFSSDGKNLGGVDSYISYNEDILEFIYTDGVKVNGAGGKLTVLGYAESESTKSFSYSVKFKAKKAGTSSIKVYDTTLFDLNENLLGSPGASVSITVKSTADLSSNANLKSVSIPAGTLSPSFSSSTTSYKVTVENSVTSFPITAITADSNASIDVSGSKTLKVGENTRKVIVTAENGSTKTYTFVITRLAGDNSEQETTPGETVAPESTDSTIITIDGENRTIVKDLTGVTLPKDFALSQCSYNGAQVSSAHSDLFSMTLMYLSKEDGSDPKFFVYNEANDSFSPFVSLTSAAMSYIILVPDETVTVPNGFTKSDILIENQKLVAWISDQEALSQFYLVYAMNSDGEVGLYLYDTVEKTIQRFAYQPFDVNASGVATGDEENANFVERIFNKLSQNKVLFMSVVIGICALCLIIAIVSIVSAVVFMKRAKRESNIELE